MDPAELQIRLSPRRRRERGISYAATVINWWLLKSEMSGDQFFAISSWALGERSTIISSTISHLRNAKSPRPHLGQFEALGASNVLIWCWKMQGKEACIQAYGPYSSWGVRPEWIERAVWLSHPEDESAPLRFTNWCELFAGLLELPYVSVALSPSENLSPALADLLNAETATAGTLREGLDRIRKAYPVKDADRVDLLLDVVTGRIDYTRDQVESELEVLAVTMATLRGLPQGAYTPGDLYAELTGGRRRT